MSEIKDKIENIVTAYVHKPHQFRELLISDLTRQFEWERKATLDRVHELIDKILSQNDPNSYVACVMNAFKRELESEETK